MRRLAGLFAVVVVVGLSAAGCGGSGGGATDGAGAGSAGAGGGAGICGVSIGESYGETCNQVMASPTCSNPTTSSASEPLPAGGTFANGAYDLTAVTIYGTTDADVGFNAERGALVVSDATASSATLDLVDVFGSVTERAHGAATVSGTNVTFTATCPPPDAGDGTNGTAAFTATPTTVTLFRVRFGLTLTSLYTKTL